MSKFRENILLIWTVPQTAYEPTKIEVFKNINDKNVLIK